jgi:two-component system, OmpR family, phosphate regulon sensor histidine kinase PhoR
VLPDIRAILDSAAVRPEEVQLATLGGESPRLLALRLLGSDGSAVGVELDLGVLLRETVREALERVAVQRGASISVIDRRGRVIAESGAPRPPDPSAAPVFAQESFEAILPFWRVRAAPGTADETRLGRSRLLLQLGMVGLLVAAMAVGAFVTLRAIDRSFELARLKSEFVSQVSHELRTPLTSIRMFAELLRTGRAKTPEKQTEYLELIDAESARLQKLIDDILDFARLEAGRKEYHFETADAGEIAEESVAALGAQLVQAGFKIDLDVRRPLPAVRIDRDSLRHAIENLLSNARKYAGDRREVSVRVVAEGAGVSIEVADAGVGIDEHDLPRIFEEFYRGREASAMQVPGSGLGLSLVKRIIDDHGGRIEVRSKVGEGTTFRIWLPGAA